MQAVGRLRHPNIVEALDAREIDGVPVLAMEYVEGIDLSKLVARVGPLAVPDACELMRQTALGLQHAHEHGLVHRDIKPSNLMLSAALALSGRATGGEGDHVLVKILDLGLALLDASRPQDSEMTAAGSAMGTADYMAPEQVTDSHSVDIRADLYSLGCTLYKLLSGHAPFADSPGEGAFHKMMAHVNRPAPSIRQRRPDVPEELAAVLQRLLAKQLGERFATPAEVAAALAPFTAGCDLPGLLRRAMGTIPADLPDAVGGTDEYRSSAFVGTDAQPRKGAASATLPRPWSRIPKLPAAIGLAALALLVLAIVFYLRDGQQTVKVEIDAELVKDATVTVWLDGREMEIRGLGETIRLKPGEHGYEIRRGDQIIRTQEFTVVRGENPALRIALENYPTVPPPPGTVEVPAVAQKPHELFFDGEYAYVETPVRYDGSHPLTLEAWVTLAEDHDADWHHVISNYDRSHGLALQVNPQRRSEVAVKLSDRPDYAEASLTQAAPQGRHHAALVFEGNQASLFVDGLRSPTTFQVPEKNRRESSTEPFIIGAHRDSQSQISAVLDGTIDEVRISRVARYRADFVPQERFEPDEDTMALYHFDEGVGYVARDASGRGNDAHIVGAEWVKVGQKPPLPGLVARPAPIPGLGRWQVAPRNPNSKLNCVAWSPDGKRIACVSDAGWVRIYDAGTLDLVCLAGGDKGAIHCVAWSPDSKWLATASESELVIRLWHADGRPGPVLAGAGGGRTWVAWHPDGRLLAIGCGAGQILLQKVDGAVQSLLEGHEGSVRCVAWSCDGRYLASAGWDKTVRLWRADGTTGPILKCHTGSVNTVAWSPDGKELVSADDKGEIRLWTEKGEPGLALNRHTGKINAVAWSPDGISAGNDVTVRVWQADGSGEPIVMSHFNPSSAVWSPEGERIASVGSDGTLRLWSADGSPGPKRGATSVICGIAYNPTFPQIALSWGESTISLWSLDGVPERFLRGEWRVGCLAWAPDGRRLAWGDAHQNIQLWKRDDDSQQTLTGHKNMLKCLAWNPKGSWLASGGSDGTVRLWHADGTPGPILEGHEAGVTAVTWAPDGDQLASAGYDSTIRYWRVDGSATGVFCPGWWAFDLSWSPTGKWLAAAGRPRLPLFSPGEQPQSRIDLLRPSGSRVVCWAGDGAMLAADQSGVTIWLLRADGKVRSLLRGHLGCAVEMSWHRDGKYLVAGDVGGNVCMWNTETCAAEWTAICLPGGRSVTFSPTGEIVHGHPKVIEEELVYLIEQPDGTTEVLKPSEFAQRAGQ